MRNGQRTLCCRRRLFVLGFSSSHGKNPSVCRPPFGLTVRIITLVDIRENVRDGGGVF